MLVDLLIFRFSARGWGTELRMICSLSVINTGCPESKQVSKSMPWSFTAVVEENVLEEKGRNV